MCPVSERSLADADHARRDGAHGGKMHGGAVKELFNVLTPRDAFARLQPYLRGPHSVEQVSTENALGGVGAVELLEGVVGEDGGLGLVGDRQHERVSPTHGSSRRAGDLSVVDEVLMGRPAERDPRAGEAIRIATGGMLPSTADAVVMVENTQDVDESTIEVLRPVAPGENMIQIGEDVGTGDLLLTAGHALRPQDIGGLLALGIVQVAVAVRLRVGIISTATRSPRWSSEPGTHPSGSGSSPMSTKSSSRQRAPASNRSTC